MIDLRIRLYYRLKPFLPSRVELFLRKLRSRVLRHVYRQTWPIDRDARHRPLGWQGWPDKKQFALVLTHDVEWERGCQSCDRLSRLEEEMGFRSAFYFVPHRYAVPSELRASLVERGFEVGLHGLEHDGKLFSSRRVFLERARQINQYLRDWNAAGFRSPAMHHDLTWTHDLDIEYDASTFDTDPFQPQSDGLRRIFPLWVPNRQSGKGYVELPYTLGQDWKVFSILGSTDIEIWRQKLDWIVEQGGMALLITHPDYMQLGDRPKETWDYPAQRYVDFLSYVKKTYEGRYWHALPRDMARFWKAHPKREEDFLAWKERMNHRAAVSETEPAYGDILERP